MGLTVGNNIGIGRFQQTNENSLFALTTDSEDGPVSFITTDSEDGPVQTILIDMEDR